MRRMSEVEMRWQVRVYFDTFPEDSLAFIVVEDLDIKPS